MGVFSWLIIGLIGGLIAGRFEHGDPISPAIFIGMFGAFLGGFVASITDLVDPTRFIDIAGWLCATAGAWWLLILYAMATGRSRPRARS